MLRSAPLQQRSSVCGSVACRPVACSAVAGRAVLCRAVRKGTSGVSTNGVTANFMFFDRGTFWVLPFTYFYIPKSARAYLFPQSVKIHDFCSGPISLDPICPQPMNARFCPVPLYIAFNLDVGTNIDISTFQSPVRSCLVMPTHIRSLGPVSSRLVLYYHV